MTLKYNFKRLTVNDSGNDSSNYKRFVLIRHCYSG